MPTATVPQAYAARNAGSNSQVTNTPRKRVAAFLDSTVAGYYRLVVHMMRNAPFRDFKAGRRILPGAVGLLAFVPPAVIGFVHIPRVVLASPVAVQSPQNPPVAFEVASIRPSSLQQRGGEGSSRSQIETAPDGLVMRNIDLSEMIQWAYRLDNYQVHGTSIVPGQRYDVSAKTDDPVSESALRGMLQDLLATRFKVRAHREQRRMAVYLLVVGKRGPRLPIDKTDSLPPAYPRESLPRIVNGDFVFQNVSMTDFARQLAEFRGIDLPIVNRTGIQGIYDITLKSAPKAILESDGSVLPALLEEQLGLKLVSAREPIDVLVVDQADKPSAN